MDLPSRAFFLAATLLLISLSAVAPGCTAPQKSNLTASELQAVYLDHARAIRDYSSEYTESRATGEDRISVDWRAPRDYRIQILSSIQPDRTGVLLFENQTAAVTYLPQDNTYTVQPDSRLGRMYDHQQMVRRIVKDGRFAIMHKQTENGKTLYRIEVVTEPWSMEYTEYTSSRIQAWIDPETGTAREISVFYPSDKVSSTIKYTRISVNTGIPDSRFIFAPPPQSELLCGSGIGIWNPENYDPAILPPALRPGCNNCTAALMELPVGGLSGRRLLVPLFEYTAEGRTIDPDPHRSINYTFYSRTTKPGTVRITASRVESLYRTVRVPVPENISILVGPGVIAVEPGHEYTTNLTIHVKPGTDLHENFWIHIHAEGEGIPDAITDDWVRLAIDKGEAMDGMGLYHFYGGGGGYCQKVVLVRAGDTGRTSFAIRTGELDTGPATLSLQPVPCKDDQGPFRSGERPVWPAGINATVSPHTFTARSFASYLPEIHFTIDPGVKPGDYCFSAISRTPSGGGDYAPLTLRVVP